MPYLLNGDCLDIMQDFPDNSFDLIKADLPYGMTNNHWDSLIPLDRLWVQYKRLIKPNGAILLNATGKFSALLICSNIKWYKYDWIWEKPKPTNHLNAKRQPMRAHEQILVFYDKQPTYNPIKTTGHKPVNTFTKHQQDGSNYGKTKSGISGGGQTDRYPRTVLKFKQDTQLSKLHPTQKPVALEEYLIRTYTNIGDCILDNTAGSGTTGIACMNTERRCVLIEKGIKEFQEMKDRIEAHTDSFVNIPH